MAVFNPGTPSLASNYANIQDALAKSADISGKDTGGYGIANAVAEPLVQEIQHQRSQAEQMGMEAFKTSLLDQLDSRKQSREFDYAGGRTLKQEDVDAFEREHGFEPGSLKGYVGTKWRDPKDLESVLTTAHAEAQKVHDAAEQAKRIKDLADEVEKTDPKRAKAIRALGVPNGKLPAGADEAIRKIAFPEDEKKPPNHGTPGTDAFGRKVISYEDGTTKIVGGNAPQEIEDGAIATKKEHLRKSESDLFNRGNAIIQKQAKPIVDQLDRIDTLKKEVADNNPSTLINIKAEDALTSGIPGGRLNSNIIKQEGFAPGIANKIDQALTQAAGGHALSKDNQKYILMYLKAKEKKYVEHLDQAIGTTAEQVHQNMPDPSRVDPDFIKDAYKKPYSNRFSKYDKAPPAKTVTQGGHVYTLNEKTGKYE